MEKVCPNCNGFAVDSPRCPRCYSQMSDGGRAEDYYGPYAPYEMTKTDQTATCCIHLFNCYSCGGETYVALSRKSI